MTLCSVLQFQDMSSVFPVDGAMLERTKSWLLGRRDNLGGFLRNAKALDAFGAAPNGVTNAYIVWALASAGYGDLVTREIDELLSSARSIEDPYIIGLAAAALFEVKREAEGNDLLKRLAPKQSDEGFLR
jgi:hypothetical protein